jgi:hypothetical protein
VPDALDPLGRTPIASMMKARIAEALRTIDEDKRGAVLVLVDDRGAQAHIAAKLNGSWKVAGGLSVPWETRKPTGWIGIEGAW